MSPASPVDTATTFLGRLPLGLSWQQDGLRGLIEKLKPYIPAEQLGIVREAYAFGAAAHEGQKRMTGERYISHPIAVASILADLSLDYQTIVAAILHDVIEDTPTLKEHIVEKFGQEVADIVDGVSKLDKLQFQSKQEAQAESLRKMMLAMAEDIRVILLKLADRLHNMRTLDAMPAPKRRRIARETLDIYAPIANRLGINRMRLELEDLGFAALHPNRYRVLGASLNTARGSQRPRIKKIQGKFEKALKNAGVAGEVTGREKHLYSIYRKMRSKHLSLSEILDVYGFRLVVDRHADCYRALGLIHAIYKPMPGRFKDYIAIPRVNGYQSLHTTLLGPGGFPIEVQIRTSEMERVAESGIAAHWIYKLNDGGALAPQARAREWLRSLIDAQQGSSSEEFLENVKIDLFPDKVYVFTPRGDIMRLPRGSTVVDFAYAVHTEVGNHCVAALVDRRRVPLRTPLVNGQTVEITTQKGARPNAAWLDFVVMAKARSAIKHYLSNLREGEARSLGKRLLERSLLEFRMRLKDVAKEDLAALLQSMNLKDMDELYVQLGFGKQLAPLLARRMAGGRDEQGNAQGADAPVAIAGTEGLVMSFARCCFPVPGDPIMGYLGSGLGVIVHRTECGNLAEFRKQPEKWINVAWEEGIDQLFTAAIRVSAANEMGVLAAVATRISGAQSNIETVTVVERDADASALRFIIQVRDAAHIESLIRSVKGMPEVMDVKRICD